MARKRLEILRQIEAVMARSGFYVYIAKQDMGYLFDIIARKDDLLLFIQVRLRLDRTDPALLSELKKLAHAINGVPLIVAMHAASGPLQDGILYLRSGIPVLTPGTLSDFFFEGVPPFVFAAPGGLYVKLDGRELRRLRHQRNLTLGDLARAAGVSRKSIQQYERGMGASVSVAIRVEEFLDVPLVLPLDPFVWKKDPESLARRHHLPRAPYPEEHDVYTSLEGLGFDLHSMIKCPFDTLGQRKKEMLLARIEHIPHRQAGKRSDDALQHVSRIAEARGVIFTPLKKRRRGSVPTVSLSELKRAENAEEILALIDERVESNGA